MVGNEDGFECFQLAKNAEPYSPWNIDAGDLERFQMV